jgi:phosphoglycerate dehydrogenase-like enzyme
MNIIIAEDMWSPLPDWFCKKWPVLHDATLWQDRDHLLQACTRAEALIVRNRTRVDRDLLRQLPHLRVVGRLGVGLDNLDLAALREHGVAVVTARGCNANAVAEYVIAALFEQARFLGQLDERTRRGVWDRGFGMGRELHGKTLGLIGVGDIGQRVAARARVFGMHIIACDPLLHPSHIAVQDGGLESVSLAEACQRADYLSLHVPLTQGTRHLIGAHELALMKETATLINTARGGIVDETALAQSLQRHPRRFAVLDVRETEPPQQPDPLASLPNVLLTPHVAGITHESERRVADMVLGDVDRVLSGKTPAGRV